MSDKYQLQSQISQLQSDLRVSNMALSKALEEIERLKTQETGENPEQEKPRRGRPPKAKE